jgi:hypothetical protein
MTDSHFESTAIQPAPTEQPEHLDLRSHDVVSDKEAEIVRLSQKFVLRAERLILIG